MQCLEKPYKRIMIVGGGNIGAGLAYRLEKDYSVKLIERDQERVVELAERLHHTIVFYGDASDQELLAQEHIEQIDVFIAITNDDEANIMSGMLAKVGAKKVLVLIQRRAYVDLVQGSIIDIAISPQQATISALLGHVRKANIVSISSLLRRGVVEAIEVIAHGDESTSRAVGRHIDAIKLPPDTIIANGNNHIEQGDRVIMFLINKKFISDVERLFRPTPFFL